MHRKFCAHGLQELMLLKCPHYPKPSTDVMQSLSPYQQHLSQSQTNKPKRCIEPQKTLNGQSTIENEEPWRYRNFSFQVLFQSCSNPNSIVGTGVQNSLIAQWNRTSNPDINPPLYGQFIFYKQERLSSGEKACSSPNGVGKTGQATCQRMNLDQFLYHTHK